MFKGWGIKTKLFSVFSISVLFLALVGFVANFMLGKVVDGFSHITHVNLPNEMNLATMNESRQYVVIDMMQLTDESSSKSELEEARKELETEIENFMSAARAYEKIPFVTGEAELWKDVTTARKAYFDSVAKIKSMVDDRSPENISRMQEVLRQDFTPNRIKLHQALTALKEFQRSEASSRTKKAEEQANSAQRLILLLVIAGFSITMVLSYFFARSFSSSLSRLALDLSSGADEVASAATQISSTSEELSSAATEQASSLQETAASVEEMSAMIKKNSDYAAKSRETTNESERTALRGKKVVDEMMEAIKAIDESNQEIADVVKVISDIGNKTKVINDIVFKTQLLSFNASVEAARAGEHGKGFAVVAEEVGNLARMSGDAAGQISTTLDESIANVQAMITRSKQKVEAGIAISNRCREVLDEIVSDVSDINGMAEQISVASDEQARGVQEITAAMSQLDQVTQQNASSSQQASSAAEQLSSQAESLRSIVSELFATVSGAGNTQLRPEESKPKRQSKTPKAKLQNCPKKTESKSGKRKKWETKQVEPDIDEELHVPDGEDERFQEAS
ncbi:MAG: HAMP domain-containing methyl-accepting chemotaxis protein [Oligoflexus sp.]